MIRIVAGRGRRGTLIEVAVGAAKITMYVLDADLASLIGNLAIRADFVSEATLVELARNVHGGEKIEFYGCRNLVGSDPRAWASQMAASAAAGRTCKRDPILHIVVSLAPGESLSRAQCERLIDVILLHLTTPGAVSAANLPVVWGTHVNTLNWHMHLVLSRVDPWTRRPVRLGNGWMKDTLQQICTLLEGEFGLRHEAQNDYCLTGGYLVHKPTGTRAARPGELIRLRKGVRAKSARNRVATAAHEALRDAIDRSGSWQEVHERLSTLKCSYRAVGKGARITMPEGSRLKASALGNGYTLSGLVRMGPYLPPAERATRPPLPFVTPEPRAPSPTAKRAVAETSPPAPASAFDDGGEQKPELNRGAEQPQESASAQKAIPSLSDPSPNSMRTADPVVSAETIQAPTPQAQQRSEVPLSSPEPVGHTNQKRLAAVFRQWLEARRSEGRFVTVDKGGRPRSPDLTAEVDEIARKLQGEMRMAILEEFARRHESDLQRLREFLVSIATDSRRYPTTRDFRIGVTNAPREILELLEIYRDDASLQALRRSIVGERMTQAERALKEELERLHDRGTFVLQGEDGQPAPPPEARRAWGAVHPERRAATAQPFLDRQDAEITELQAWCAEPGRERQRDLFAEDGRLDPTDPSPRIASLMKLYEADPRFHEIVAELRRRVDAHRVLQANIARARYNEGWGREVN